MKNDTPTLEQPQQSLEEIKAKQTTYKVNPEVEEKIKQYKAAHPNTLKIIKEMPRERLENEFILKLIRRDEQRQALNQRIKDWVNKPENAEIKKALNQKVREEALKYDLKPSEQAALFMKKAAEARQLDAEHKQKAKEWVNQPENAKLKEKIQKAADKKPFKDRAAFYVSEICSQFEKTMNQTQTLAR